ncbi:MAG: helicase-associated domain-containing protein [Chloroflexota bacterium]|nr:helicase-associated domain-containing protein [Chloroflexota bacterium]
MPDLEHSLHGHDLGHLRIVAELWGVELGAPDTRTALPQLVEQLSNPSLVEEIVETLPQEARAALNALQQKNSRILWGQFSRRFGDVREIGPGRRDRQRPDQNPTSPAEMLWYRALIARAFFDTARGTEEFAYIPDDLIPLIPGPKPSQHTAPLGRAATLTERADPIPADDQILDHACTLLAASRIERDSVQLPKNITAFLRQLLIVAGLLDSDGHPNINAVRAHLESPRGEALAQLAQAWLNSPTHNDLHLVPQLQAEGEWENDPLAARRFIVRLLDALPKDTWWSISAFIADVRQAHPDFQRPAGDYDSWYLRDTHSGEFLRGFEHWDDVDGALIRYLITGPLHWLGLIDLASPEDDAPSRGVMALRPSKWAAALFHGIPPEGIPAESAPIHIRSDGRVGVPLLVPRSARYQIARFCRWEKNTLHEYRYCLTPESLERARQQGLRIGHLLKLLNEHAAPVPPNITKALKRWAEYGTEARTVEMVVLRVNAPHILKMLQNSRAARFLGLALGPTAITVKPGAEEKVLAVLLELGYLGEIKPT